MKEEVDIQNMSLTDLFSVSSICLVGASREEGKVGNVILKNLKKN